MNSYRKCTTRKACLVAGLLLTVTLAGCDGSDAPKPIAEPQPEELRGIWLRTGYGDAFVVTDNGAELYQFTQLGCLKADTLSNYDVAQLFVNPELSSNQAVLTLKAPYGLAFDTRLERQSALPATCSGDTLITDSTPTATFEHLWHLFNDYYAFFDERSVDWNAQYADLRPLVNDMMTNEELFNVIGVLLEPLDDGHVQLTIDDEIYDFSEYRGANRVIFENFPLQTEYEDIQEYANAVSTTFKDIRASYLDAGSVNSLDGARRDQFLWGTIGGRIGYLRVASMSGLSRDESGGQANLKSINEIMSAVMADLQSTSAIIFCFSARHIR